MENTITFNYMPYIHFDAYKFVLENLRKHYPFSDVFIYFDAFRDDCEKYKEIAVQHNCKFIIKDVDVFYTNREDSFEINSKKLLEVYDRITFTCENTQSDWILILEDDVYIKKQIENFPKANVGTCRSYFRPGGGAIFNRKVFLDSIKKVSILDIMKTIPDANWAADVVLEHIFLRNGASFEEWQELAEPNYRDSLPHSIYHGYKELYNKNQ